MFKQSPFKGNTMKQSINFSQFVDAFHAYKRYDQFGYDALRIIFDFLESYEQDTGEELELDVIAICCDYTVDDYVTIAQDYSIDLSDADGDEDEAAQIVLDYLNDNTCVLGTCPAGIVYQSF
jgi:hypothetical protein